MQKKESGQNPQANFIRVNMYIRVPHVRVVYEGNQLGIMTLAMAMKKAEEYGLDLIEVVPHANPPVCHIEDLGHFRFEQKQKEKELRKKQREAIVETKEVRVRPGTDDHDIDTKAKMIRRFLEAGDKVQINLDFKNREMAHKEEGFAVMAKLLESVADISLVEQKPRLEGRRLIARLALKLEK